MSCPSASSGSISLTAIQTSSSPPTSLSQGKFMTSAANTVSTTRRLTAPATPQKMPCLAQLWRKVAAGQRNNDRVVAGQHNVDQDNLADGNPEYGRGEIKFHKTQAKKKAGTQPAFLVEQGSDFTAMP
jgi:hypothetical protein